MKITKAEGIIIAVTMILLSFTAGFFFGKSQIQNSVVVQAASPENSETVGAVDSNETSVAEPSVEVSISLAQTDLILEIENSAAEAVSDMPDDSSQYDPEPEPEPTETVEPSPIGYTSSGLIDINTADVAVLDTLPGIGEVLAQRIVDYRTEYGNFLSIDEIKNVSGIGEKTFEKIRAYIGVE